MKSALPIEKSREFVYEIRVRDDGEIVITVSTYSAAVAIEINERIAKTASVALETLDMEAANAEAVE